MSTTDPYRDADAAAPIDAPTPRTTADEPAAYEPTADEPAAYEPAAYEPTAYEPTAYESTADEPAADPVGGTTGAGGTTDGPAVTHHDVLAGDRLMPRERAAAYTSRWDSVKSGFVDEPRQAVAQADALVGELLGDLHRILGDQREQLADGLDTASTEDLRVALRRYRTFVDRLVSL